MASGRPKRAAASAATKAMTESKAKPAGVAKAKATPKATASKKTTKSGSKASANKTQANIGKPRKRKAEDGAGAAPAAEAARATKASTASATKKKAPARKPRVKEAPTEAEQKPTVINQAPIKALKVYVFGSNQQGELGLGQGTSVNDVKRPRLNPHLDPETVGVVQLSIGALHVAALTRDNKILTWGVNDLGALGRNTEWDGGMKDMKEDDASDSSEGEVNPKEATPMEVDMSELLAAGKSVKWVQVEAGDNATFALTEEGEVYGWGTFKSADGSTSFIAGTDIAHRPIHFATPDPIIKIAAGANHVMALTTKGAVLCWGINDDCQLGRSVNERTRHHSGLKPESCGLDRNIKEIGTGSTHSFAIHKNGSVYAWGKNNFCQTGIDKQNKNEDYFTNIIRPSVIQSLKGHGKVISITGGNEHSIALTDTGLYLSWGRCDTHALGLDLAQVVPTAPEGHFRRNQRDQPVILTKPITAPIPELALNHVSASSDHSIVVDQQGKAWSSGFSGNHQTGLGTDEDVEMFMVIENTAVKEQKVVWAGCGAQFSALAAEVGEKMEE